MIRSLKPNLQKVVYHTALSIGNEEKLTDKEFASLAKEYLTQMGFSNSQYLIYRHTDRDHPHVHIIANRVSLDGQVVTDKWDFKRSENIVRGLEVSYGLQLINGSSKVMEASLSKGQVEFFRRTQTIPVKKQLQIAVGDALASSASLDGFEKKLAEYGVSLKLHENNSDQVFGVSFELDGIAFKGSALGRGYSWKNINEKLTNNYERNRGSSQEIRGGTQAHVGRSDREIAENQYGQYRGTDKRISADSGRHELLDGGVAARSGKHTGATTQSHENDSIAGAEHVKVRLKDGGVKEAEHPNNAEVVSHHNSERGIDRSNGISALISKITEQFDFGGGNSENAKRRKKRKVSQ